MVLIAVMAIFFTQKTQAKTQSINVLQTVITDYLNLKNALSNDAANNANVAANRLLTDLKSVPMEKLTTDQHKIWMQYHASLINEASAIGKTGDLEKQRSIFKTFSPDFFNVLKRLKISNIELYYQYCPMADAYWVSESQKIANPYLGQQMKSCGSTKETLKTLK